METFKWIWHYLKDYKIKYGLGILFVLIAGMISLINPILGGQIVDKVLIKGETGYLIPILAIMLVTVVIKNIIEYTKEVLEKVYIQNEF